MNLVHLGGHTASILSKAAPVVGGATVLLAFQAASVESSVWSELWRIGFSVCLAVFISLVGAIYQNMSRRLGILERAAKEDFVPRTEYEARHRDIKAQLDRIESQGRNNRR